MKSTGDYDYSETIKLVAEGCDVPAIITVAPNPVKNILVISGLQGNDNTVLIYDHTGNLIYKNTATGDQMIGTRAYPPGNYLFQVKAADGRILANIKLVKE